jgi:hypothetical protein
MLAPFHRTQDVHNIQRLHPNKLWPRSPPRLAGLSLCRSASGADPRLLGASCANETPLLRGGGALALRKSVLALPRARCARAHGDFRGIFAVRDVAIGPLRHLPKRSNSVAFGG